MLYSDDRDNHRGWCLQGRHTINKCIWVRDFTLISLSAALLPSFTSPIVSLTLSCNRFAVSTVMFTTSVLIMIQIPYVKQLPIAVAIVYFMAYGFIDGAGFLPLLKSGAAISFDDRPVLGCIVEKDTGRSLGAAYDGQYSVRSFVPLFQHVHSSQCKIDI